MEIIKGYIIRTFSIFGLLTGLASCTDNVAEMSETEYVDETKNICIGGMETESLTLDADNPAMTRASEGQKQDAETVEWLLAPLFSGLDITYRQSGSSTREVAILKLKEKTIDGGYTLENIKISDGGFAEYSFNYRKDRDKTAQWFGNGYHYFEGVYVPNEIRYNEAGGSNATTTNTSLDNITNEETGTAKGLHYDQSEDQASRASGYTNYTLLEHYLAMPANWGHNATVDRIKLPFKHRLARVIAYVLIDPVIVDPLTGPVKIKGYNYQNDGQGTIIKDDPTSSAIRFSNVKVLNGVEERIDDTGHATLTPKWTTARKAIPHFLDERGSVNAAGDQLAEDFIVYYKADEKKYIFPANDESDTKRPWTTANTAWNAKFEAASGTDEEKIKKADEQSGYVRTVYGKVPVYDLIVRPTYTSTNTVMYDEDRTGTTTTTEKLANETNTIHFEITLANDLHYEKEFEFDLDANEQTIVYLRIKPESVNYNSSGAEVWTEEGGSDGYYGVNNQNGNTLSFAGNSWQRAYRIGTKHDNVTDGHFYDKDTEDEYAQYVDADTWIKMFTEACMKEMPDGSMVPGKHHGDYFILDNNITIPAGALPEKFVFTGHLDAQGHTITVKGAGQPWEEYISATVDDYSSSETVLYTDKNKTSVFQMPELLFTKETHPAILYTDENDIDLLKIGDVLYLKSSLVYTEPKAAEVFTVEEYNKVKGRSLDEGLTAEAFDALSAEEKESFTNVEDYNNAKVKLTEEQFENLSDGEKVKTPAVDEKYEPNENSKVITLNLSIKNEAYDTYTEANPQPSRYDLLTATEGTFFTREVEEEQIKYPPFIKPEYLYTECVHTYNAFLFKGLYGTYPTPQEINESDIWLANVHKEGSTWVPVAGYRAELLNVKLAEGCKFFPEGAVFTGKELDKTEATVSGYIFNCWEGSTKIENIVPIPHY